MCSELRSYHLIIHISVSRSWVPAAALQKKKVKKEKISHILYLSSLVQHFLQSSKSSPAKEQTAQALSWTRCHNETGAWVCWCIQRDVCHTPLASGLASWQSLCKPLSVLHTHQDTVSRHCLTSKSTEFPYKPFAVLASCLVARRVKRVESP